MTILRPAAHRSSSAGSARRGQSCSGSEGPAKVRPQVARLGRPFGTVVHQGETGPLTPFEPEEYTFCKSLSRALLARSSISGNGAAGAASFLNEFASEGHH